MQFDSQKAFPFPVLRPGSSDYLRAEFQTTTKLTVKEGLLTLEVNHGISSKEVSNAVTRGHAVYACVVSCRDTYFRQVLKSSRVTYSAQFPVDHLRGEVAISPFVVAIKPIGGYEPSDISSEFGGRKFDIAPGDVLAQDEPQVFYIDRDIFKPVTSVFDLVKNKDLEDGEWTLGYEEDHVQIEVSPGMKEKLDDARNVGKNRTILLNSLYFPAVMQTISKLQQAGAEFEGKKWAQVIQQQAQNLGRDFQHEDAHVLAQQLMRLPLLRLKEVLLEGMDK